jgi:glycine betaine/proline transport system substrate-binding protein
MTFLFRNATLAAGALLAGVLGPNAPATAQDDASCDLERPVMFAGLNYESAAYHTAVAQLILREGYGCEVDALPGDTIPLINGVGRGDIDVIMEIWTANPAQAWVDAEAAGTVVALGTTFPDAQEGWWVPKYLVEGESAPAKDLKSVDDLAGYKELFKDPEEPSKGRFHNCPAGWQCEVVNSKKLIAYGLDDDYTNFRPGTGTALDAAITSAYLRERPILFYTWSPTALMGEYAFAKIEEPPFDQATWDAMMASDAATAYPVSKVVIGANKAFVDAAPAVAGFLEAYASTSDATSKALAYMKNEKATAEEAAVHFLKEDDGWKAWVPAAVAGKVEQALAGS